VRQLEIKVLRIDTVQISFVCGGHRRKLQGVTETQTRTVRQVWTAPDMTQQ